MGLVCSLPLKPLTQHLDRVKTCLMTWNHMLRMALALKGNQKERMCGHGPRSRSLIGVYEFPEGVRFASPRQLNKKGKKHLLLSKVYVYSI